MKRTSVVNQIETISFTNGSIYQIGDTAIATPESRAIAVQKEGPSIEKDLHYESFPIFKRKANFPSSPPHVRKKTVQHHPYINVDSASIGAFGSASLLHIGSLNHVAADARVKHIRILLRAYH